MSVDGSSEDAFDRRARLRFLLVTCLIIMTDGDL